MDFSETYQRQNVVIDLGMDSCKIGFSEPAYDNENPLAAVKTLLRQQKDGSFAVGDSSDFFLDDSSCSFPIERGVVTNWEHLEILMNHLIYEEARVYDVEERAFLFNYHYGDPPGTRETMMELMFETMNVPALHFDMDSSWCMYQSGYTTGLAVCSGAGVTSIVPIYEGYVIEDAINRLNFGGCDLTEYLASTQQGKKPSKRVLNDIKESCCSVSHDYEQEIQNYDTKLDKTYKTLEGQTFSIGMEQFTCAEGLFNPSLIGMSGKGIPELIHDTIERCPIDAQKDISKNLMMTGRNIQFPGFEEKCLRQLKELGPHRSVEIRHKSPDIWLGGCVLASLSEFSRICTSKEQYDEEGPKARSFPIFTF